MQREVGPHHTHEGERYGDEDDQRLQQRLELAGHHHIHQEEREQQRPAHRLLRDFHLALLAANLHDRIAMRLEVGEGCFHTRGNASKVVTCRGRTDHSRTRIADAANLGWAVHHGDAGYIAQPHRTIRGRVHDQFQHLLQVRTYELVTQDAHIDAVITINEACAYLAQHGIAHQITGALQIEAVLQGLLAIEDNACFRVACAQAGAHIRETFDRRETTRHVFGCDADVFQIPAQHFDLDWCFQCERRGACELHTAHSRVSGDGVAHAFEHELFGRRCGMRGLQTHGQTRGVLAFGLGRERITLDTYYECGQLYTFQLAYSGIDLRQSCVGHRQRRACVELNFGCELALVDLGQEIDTELGHLDHGGRQCGHRYQHH